MEEILKQILGELGSLKEGQQKLEKGQVEIKTQLEHVWEDIRRIDKRLTKQEDETYLLTRMK